MLYVDNSILKSVQTCHLQATLRYVLGLTTGEERIELQAGTAVHAFMEAYHKNLGAQAAFHAFDDVYKGPGQKVSVEDRLSWRNVRRILNRFQLAAKLPYDFPDPACVEAPFEVPLIDDIAFVGRLDALVPYKGRPIVLEVKTTGSLSSWWKDEWQMSSQLTGYVYGANAGRVGGMIVREPVEEIAVLGIELRKLPVSDTKCKEHGLRYSECGEVHAKWEFHGPYHRPQGLIARWKEEAIAAAKEYAALVHGIDSVGAAARICRTQGQFNGGCKRCEFQSYCVQGLPVEAMEANLVYEPWDPRHLKHQAVPVTDTQLVQVDRRPVTPAMAPLPTNIPKMEAMPI